MGVGATADLCPAQESGAREGGPRGQPQALHKVHTNGPFPSLSVPMLLPSLP